MISCSSLRAPALLLIAMLALAGCGSESGFNEDTDFVNKEGSVQFVNMIPDSPELTMLHGISSQNVVPFSVASPPELRFEDRYDWRIAYLNSNNDQVTVAEQDNQQISEATLSTFLFLGTMSLPNIVVFDQVLQPPADRPADRADVWFASNLTTHSMVDIYLTDFGEDLATVAPLLSLNSMTHSQVLSVAAGETKQLRIMIAGTDTLLFDSGSIDIPEQSHDLFGLVDDFGPDAENHIDVLRSITATGSVIPDVSQPALVRVSNLGSNDALSADVAGITFSDLDAGARSAYTSAPLGSQAVTVTSGSDTLADSTVTIQAGRFLSLLIFDDVNAQTQPAAITTLARDQFRSVTQRAQFKFVNGSSQVIDFYALRNNETTENTAPTFDNVANTTSATVEVFSGQVQFIANTNDGSQTLDSLTLTLVEGTSYTVVFDSAGEIRVLED